MTVYQSMVTEFHLNGIAFEQRQPRLSRLHDAKGVPGIVDSRPAAVQY
jgi:hypothetical protein